MKKKILGILLTAALMVSLCGTVFATETSEQEEETTEFEVADESDSAMIVDSFFSDSTTTFVKGAKTVGDIVFGIGEHTYTVNAANADTIADDIATDSDFITAITFDASDVDFDTVGEYTVIYRIFIDVDALNDYIEDNDIDDVDISDITSDSINVCIPCTVSIVDEDEDIETDETADSETQNPDDFTVVEINELTWTYEQINSIPDVITGIGSINPEDEDIDPDFDIDMSIVDAVLYDISSVDSEKPDNEDVAYYTYFDREALIGYMEETNIDIETYEGLFDTTTDYIMVYYGPITELALADVIDGLTDHYVLVDSENIDYEYGITYNDDVVKSITTNSEDVDLSEIGTYDVEYTITIDKNALEEVKNNDATVLDDTDTDSDTDIDSEIEDADTESETDDIESEDIDTENTDIETEDTASNDTETPDEDLEDIIINKTVDVVDEETADELVKDGEVVWTDDNEIYGDTEENVVNEDIKEESKTDEKTEDKDTEVAVNDSDTAKDNNDNTSSSASENKSSNDSSSSNNSDTLNSSNSSSSSNSNSSSSKSSSSSSSKSSSSSSSSGSSSSGNSSSSSGNTQTHTHNYVGTVTKSATCTSNGTKTYTCSCGASYTESIPATGHNWVGTYHEATGHYETVTVQAAYDEKVLVGGHYVCNRCGENLGTDLGYVGDHCSAEGSGYYAVDDYETVHHDAVTEQKWVQDSAAYTSYKCSNCGATK